MEESAKPSSGLVLSSTPSRFEDHLLDLAMSELRAALLLSACRGSAAASWAEAMGRTVAAHLLHEGGKSTRVHHLGSDIGDLSLAWVQQNLPNEQIAKVLQLAVSVFENEDVAKEWLNQPNLATDEKPPIALLGSSEGFSRVQTLLHRIEYGVLA